MGPFGPALALGCRIVLAAVLVVAAGAKIVDRRALPARLHAMGVRGGWDARLAVALPVAELVIAVALVAEPHSSAPSVAAVVLLAAFTVFLVATFRRGVPCPCFGAVRTARPSSGRGTIVRNGFLMGLGVLGTASVDGARAGGTLLVVAVGAAAAVAAVLRLA